MEITISVLELLYAILILLGIVLLFYLILLTKNAYTVLKKFNDSVDKTRLDRIVTNLDDTTKNAKEVTDVLNENSKEIMPMIPGIVKDVQEISTSSRKTVKNVEGTVESIHDGVSRTTEAFSSGAEDVVSYIKIIGEVIKTVFGMFSKDDD